MRLLSEYFSFCVLVLLQCHYFFSDIIFISSCSQGNELPRVLLETILRMKPTDEEEQNLRLYNGDFSQLGLAEQVMKALIDTPFAFKRVDMLLFMSSLQEDASSLRDSFHQLEVINLTKVVSNLQKGNALTVNYIFLLVGRLWGTEAPPFSEVTRSRAQNRKPFE